MDAGGQAGHGESSGSESPGEQPRGSDVTPDAQLAAIESALAALRGRGPGAWPFGGGRPGGGAGSPGGPEVPGPPGAGPWGPAGRRGGPHHGHHHDGGHDHEHGHRGGPGARGGQAALRLLIALEKHGPSSVSDLAAHVGVDQPRTSRLVQAAVDAGQVRREADPRDARRSILVLTDAGRAALRSLLDRRRSAIEAALAGFTPADRAEFARLLAKFAAAWPRA